MHDLIREHARALAGRLDPDHDRDDAVIRLLDYYHHTAARADALSRAERLECSIVCASAVSWF